MTKLYIYPDDPYESKPARGDSMAGRFYYSIQDLLDDECLTDNIEDGETYTVIEIDTDNFKEIKVLKKRVEFTMKQLYKATPKKEAKKK